jgi:hypothetical protein
MQPGIPGGAGAGSSSAFGGSAGGWSGGFAALFVAFTALALCVAGARVSPAPARWRPVAFISLLERPG